MRVLQNKYFLPALLGISLLVRVLIGLFYGQYNQLPDYFSQYEPITRALASGQGYIDTRPPGFILFLLPFFAFWGTQHLLPAIIGQCIVGTIFVYIVYLLAKNIFGEIAGRIAGSIACIYPWMVYYASQLSVEQWTAFWVALSILQLIIFTKKPTFRQGLVTGLVLGFTAWVRSTFVLYVILIILLLLFTQKRKNYLLAVLVGFFIMIASWTAYNGILTHTWSFTGGNADHNLYIGLNPMNKTGGAIWGKDAPEISDLNKIINSLPPDQAKTYYRDEVRKFVTTQPYSVLTLACKKMFIFWRPYPQAEGFTNLFTILVIALTFIPVTLLGLFGLGTALRNKAHQIPALMILLYILQLNCLHLVFAASLVYRWPIEPLLIVGTAGTLGAFFSNDKKR